ncbi:hypothetical protein MLD38_017236 [Melastoma candidum]|uniref:Uncharacterized protein n=1 Tax=Melastoma candidum TaxID=119954 RepID=A0ACB9QQ22_9MYRT|nr:hypothetical protein MLD38_017236 [Melastoma candidum]
MFVPLAVAALVGVVGLVYRSLRSPPPKICGSADGPPVTSPRVKLSDGRCLAYREVGVPRGEAKHKIVVVHGFSSSKDLNLPIDQELVDELKLYVLHYDRAGYGESDPKSPRTVRDEATDIQELADLLELGSKFYVIGISMGGYPAWSCLKYIPHRLNGVALVAPFVHYWWPDFPSGDMNLFSRKDLDILKNRGDSINLRPEKITQQGAFVSLHQDFITGYSRWGFGPLELENPFPNGEGSVHIWQGFEDRIIPYEVNRYIADKLPWVRYHEVADGGHLCVFEKDVCEQIIRSLVTA